MDFKRNYPCIFLQALTIGIQNNILTHLVELGWDNIIGSSMLCTMNRDVTGLTQKCEINI